MGVDTGHTDKVYTAFTECKENLGPDMPKGLDPCGEPLRNLEWVLSRTRAHCSPANLERKAQ